MPNSSRKASTSRGDRNLRCPHLDPLQRQHLLGLINTVLDIAKIESGQFTLNMTEYAIESVVETVRAATESLAQNKKLTLTTSVDKSLPVGLGDEQRASANQRWAPPPAPCTAAMAAPSTSPLLLPRAWTASPNAHARHL